MSKCKGTVTAQGKSQYSFYVQLDTKDGFYFNTKFEPKSGIGDVVGIEYEAKGDKRGNVQKITILEDNGGPKGVQKKASGSGYKAEPGRQDSIVFQSSRKDALMLVGILLNVEAFALKGKPDARRVQLEELLDEVTARFFKDASAPLKSAVLTANAEIEEDAGESDEWDNSKDDGDEWDD